MYYYGPAYPWEVNALPNLGLIEGKLAGLGCDYCGLFNFYSMFSGNGTGTVSSGGKPFIFAEAAAAFHEYIHDSIKPSPGPGRLAIKQTWWRQFLNSTFLNLYPKVKGYCSFEFIKREETSLRDYSLVGPVPKNLDAKESQEVADAFKKDMEALISSGAVHLVWANSTKIVEPSGGGNTKSASFNLHSNFIFILSLLLCLIIF